MEPKGSLQHSQVPTTWLYPEPDLSSPCPRIPLPEESFLPVIFFILVRPQLLLLLLLFFFVSCQTPHGLKVWWSGSIEYFV